VSAVDHRRRREQPDLQRALVEAARNSDEDLLEANRSLPTLLLLAFVAAVTDGVAGGNVRINKAA
jgi:hypothetical protein